MPTYLPYSDAVEERQPDEDENIQHILATFARLRAFTFEKHRHGLRGAHAKSHGILKGELAVLPGLAPELAQGLFREARTFPVIARFSTSPGDILPDRVAGFRGLAVKVVGVEGPKVLPELADAVTQDFLLINHPILPTGTIQSFLTALLRMEKFAHAPEEVQEGMTAVTSRGGELLQKVGIDAVGVIGQGKPHTHILGETYFTTAPIRYGGHVARLALVPVSESLRALAGTKVDTSSDGVLRDLVVEHFRTPGGEWELRVQLRTNADTMPVEDAAVDWPEDESPYVPVARLAFPAQDAFSPARRVFADDALLFSPWHCLVEHRPLGGVMRVRRLGYELSARDRRARNASPTVEPRSIEELPD